MAGGIGQRLLPPALKIRRTIGSKLSGEEIQEGEQIFVLDTKEFYIGDGTVKVLINPNDLSAFNNDVGYIKESDDKIMDGGSF